MSAAAEAGGPIVPVYIWSPEEEGAWAPGAAGRWWLHQSLKSLEERLRAAGSRLIFRQGPSLKILEQLIKETNASAVFWNRRYEPAAVGRDAKIKGALSSKFVNARSFNAALLHEPWTVQTQSGKPFHVFTPFWKTCLQMPPPPKPSPAPGKISPPSRWPSSDRLNDLKLEPALNWADGFRSYWTPGEDGARKELKNFMNERLDDYARERDRPGRGGTSRLSPYLHFGEIGPRQIWHAVEKEKARGKETFLKELGWREFGHHLLFHCPSTADKPLRPEFENFPWEKNPAALERWKKGKTGYPIVDAGLRELWATGWMHNRVRMIVASFLIKDLGIHWLEGARWFWDTLVDADLANNTLGWQWSAGCGADAAPFFRIFNPVTQSENFDPDGAYIRRWVPELKNCPDEFIHAPWKAGPAFSEKNYPGPMVDHGEARRRALRGFEIVKKKTSVQRIMPGHS